jgi:maleate cis-trans isomerase
MMQLDGLDWWRIGIFDGGAHPMTIRRRIGLLVPSTNSTAEPDFHRSVPPGVTVHSHRLWIDPTYQPEALDGMNSQLAVGAKQLAAAHVEAVCMAGTANSFYKGEQGSTWMEDEMRLASGLPAIASSPSVVQALRTYGVKKLSVVTPYPDWYNLRLHEYFTAAGFDVLNVAGDPRVSRVEHPQYMNDQDPTEIADFAVSNCRNEADAVFCSCSGWRAMEAAADIERRTGKLTITTNMATVWRTLKKLEINDAGAGISRLLNEMPPIEDPVTRAAA